MTSSWRRERNWDRTFSAYSRAAPRAPRPKKPYERDEWANSMETNAPGMRCAQQLGLVASGDLRNIHPAGPTYTAPYSEMRPDG